jgi:hypothetical protein
MIYGAILAAFGGSAVALSLAEMASMSVLLGLILTDNAL